MSIEEPTLNRTRKESDEQEDNQKMSAEKPNKKIRLKPVLNLVKNKPRVKENQDEMAALEKEIKNLKEQNKKIKDKDAVKANKEKAKKYKRRMAELKEQTNNFISQNLDSIAKVDNLIEEMCQESKDEREKEYLRANAREAAEEAEKLSPAEKQSLFNGVANWGYRISKYKNTKMSEGLNVISRAFKDKSIFNKYFKNYADIYSKQSESNQTMIENQNKNLIAVGSGVAGGVGNLFKYGRVAYDIADSSSLRRLNPFRHVTAAAMFLGRSSEAAKETRLKSEDALSRTRVGREEEIEIYNRVKRDKLDEKKLNQEEKEKYKKAKDDIDRAEKEGWDVYEQAKKASQNKALTKEDFEKAYRQNLPKDILKRFERNHNLETNLILSFLKKDSDVKKYADKLDKKITKIENDDELSAEDKKRKIDAYISRNKQLIDDLDRMIGDRGTADGVAYWTRFFEKTSKGVANVLIIDSIHRLATASNDYFHFTEKLKHLCETKDSGEKEIVRQAIPGEKIRMAIPREQDLAPPAESADEEYLPREAPETSSPFKVPDDIAERLKPDFGVPEEAGPKESPLVSEEAPEIATLKLEEDLPPGRKPYPEKTEPAEPEPTRKLVPEKIAVEALKIEVKAGDSIWSLGERHLDKYFQTKFSGISDKDAIEALKIYNIDKLKDAIVEDPEKYGLEKGADFTGLSRSDLEKINFQQAIKDAFGEKGIIENLKAEQIENIVKNNRDLSEFVKKHPNTPLTDNLVNRILNGELNQAPEAVDLPQVEIDDSLDFEAEGGETSPEQEIISPAARENLDKEIKKKFAYGLFNRKVGTQAEEYDMLKDMPAREALAGGKVKFFQFFNDQFGKYLSGLEKTGHRDFVGNQLDAVEIHNRQELYDYLVKAQEQIDEPKAGESINGFLSRYEESLLEAASAPKAEVPDSGGLGAEGKTAESPPVQAIEKADGFVKNNAAAIEQAALKNNTEYFTGLRKGRIIDPEKNYAKGIVLVKYYDATPLGELKIDFQDKAITINGHEKFPWKYNNSIDSMEKLQKFIRQEIEKKLIQL